METMQFNTIVLSSSSQQILTVSVMLILIFIILILIILYKLKPWLRTNPSRLSIKADDDVERPLVSEDLSTVEDTINESNTSYSIEVASHQKQEAFTSPRSVTVAPNKNLSTSPQLKHGDSFILDIPDDLENSSFSQTLKRPISASQLAEEQQIHEEREDRNYSSNYGAESADIGTPRSYVPSYTENQRCNLMLEVIAGPSRGLSYSILSTDASKLPVNIGRVSPADILLKDSEVSGKHAMINWNVNKLKWELVDMGSLNGTLLNSQTVHRHQSGSRHWGNPVDLSSGDVITLGTSSKILVHITAETEREIPFGIGTASDPMSMRRGAKKLPMEDVCYYQWPLTGINEFGLFGICDGHGGADAATSASKIMPEVIVGILSDPVRRKKVLKQCDASDVLREAFIQTEARINHYYEGCTATVLLLWADAQQNFYAQCANVGDSACLVNTEGKQIKMSEDHRIVSHSERARFQALGAPLRDGETRICGINLARMIGDKFLKEQDPRFSSEPYLSEVVHIRGGSNSFALLASDGFWDVVSTKKAFQLVHQMMEGSKKDSDGDSAVKIANLLLSEARTLRTKDNTSIIFLDFSTTNRNYSCRLDP